MVSYFMMVGGQDLDCMPGRRNGQMGIVFWREQPHEMAVMVLLSCMLIADVIYLRIKLELN